MQDMQTVSLTPTFKSQHVQNSLCNANLVNAILRQNFMSFAHKVFITLHPRQEFLGNWHLDLISEYLEAVEKNQISRLLINIPPRHLKSICINVAWSAWLIGHKPNTQIISASYSNALSYRHFSSLRTVIQSDWYQKCCGYKKLIKRY